MVGRIAIVWVGLWVLIALGTPLTARCQAAGTIATVAGGGAGGDGSPAIQARLASPRYLAVDAGGTLYISDEAMGKIRKVGPDGIITTIAGQGGIGDAGDGGKATDALMDGPEGLCVDSSGRVYVADTGNHRVRRFTVGGTIETVAGNGIGGFMGDGGPATAAELFSPKGVAVDGRGILFISDSGNHRIRRVGLDGTIETIAGNGDGGFANDDGAAITARLAEPQGLAVDAQGDVFVADWGSHRVRRVDPLGQITTLAGNGIEGSSGDGGLALSAAMKEPSDVALDTSGNLFIADENAGRVRKVDPSGRITTVAGNGMSGSSGDGGPAVAANVSWPTGLALDSAGDLFIADNCYSRVRKVFAVAGPGYFPAPPRLGSGDVNGDGKVSVQDAMLILAYLVNLRTLTPDQRSTADVNGDGKIDVSDVHQLLRKIVGLPSG